MLTVSNDVVIARKERLQISWKFFAVVGLYVVLVPGNDKDDIDHGVKIGASDATSYHQTS